MTIIGSSWWRDNQHRIAKIQKRLADNPLDVGSMAILGRLMLEEKNFVEAEIWLNGRSVQLHRQELARRRNRPPPPDPRHPAAIARNRFYHFGAR